MQEGQEEILTAVLRTPNSVLSGAGAGTEGVLMKLVNSSEYSDLYSSLLAMMMVAKAETSSTDETLQQVQSLSF
jgi:hypothetical protein